MTAPGWFHHDNRPACCHDGCVAKLCGLSRVICRITCPPCGGVPDLGVPLDIVVSSPTVLMLPASRPGPRNAACFLVLAASGGDARRICCARIFSRKPNILGLCLGITTRYSAKVWFASVPSWEMLWIICGGMVHESKAGRAFYRDTIYSVREGAENGPREARSAGVGAGGRARSGSRRVLRLPAAGWMRITLPVLCCSR